MPGSPTRFTSRAAVLAVVVCAIALSLAYPVREYLAQRRQIDALQAQRQAIVAQLSRLEAQQRQMRDPAYVEQLARQRLHFCLRGQTCYLVIGAHHHSSRPASVTSTPWYELLWQSVERVSRSR
jgi:cell division protein FtsB